MDESDYLELVADGWTLDQIGELFGFSAGSLRRKLTATPDLETAYLRARRNASDLLESEIIETARNSHPRTCVVDKVKIDTLKWVAARRDPDRYGNRVVQDHRSGDGTMTPPGSGIDYSKLSDAAVQELMNARD